VTLPEWPEALHSVQRRYLAEELVRLRRSDEQRCSAAPQRSAKIDPNPHQIEAVIFALARLREGGCILADEVGLGKTIEAGLVIAQLLAEGARRVLLVAPKSLVGQWRQELSVLFGIEVRDGKTPEGDGVFLINREFAGTTRGHATLMRAAAFDLCVIDEAHEVFANLYKRFGKNGSYDASSDEALTAGKLREVLIAGRTPVMLLTATPIQNNLAELWGLVQYVDPLGTLLGDLPTFREVFCEVDDRQLAPGQETELRGRLKHVLQRTLRRQAQGFLEKPFVHRQARLFEYPMSVAERSLYDDVTRYLLEPGILAFQGSSRQLLLLGFHRRMASSTRALAASLEKVAARLRRMASGDLSERDDELDEMALEEADEPITSREPLVLRGDPAIELARVEGFVARAHAVANDDGKFKALLSAMELVAQAARDGQGSEKVVIFTESLVTQEHLRAQLIASGLRDDQLTLFRGVNDSPRARQALERWRAEVGSDGTSATDIETRLALVHELKTRSRVLISTEAGAKGLNLQFCNTVVNYDLPWNPQRIEQRIGRCHRYGQQHDVTVINLIAKDNEAQALTFEILSRKLELFGTVLSASDEVLHQSSGSGGEMLVSALGAEFEAELRRIYERARTLEEVTAELRALRVKVGEERRRFEETHQRTSSAIEERLDERLQALFRKRRDELPPALAEFDRDLARVVTSSLKARGTPFLLAGNTLEVEGDTVAIGASSTHSSLHLAHPLVLRAVAEARAALAGRPVLVQVPETLVGHRGQRGHLRLVRVTYEGFEREQRIVPAVVLERGVLDLAEAQAFLRGTFQQAEVGQGVVTSYPVEEAVEELLFGIQRSIDVAEHARFELALRQANRYIEDRLLVLSRRRAAAQELFSRAQSRWEGATGSDARTTAESSKAIASTTVEMLTAEMERLQKRDDETFRRHVSQAEARRYARPVVETLLDLDFDIA